MICSTIQKLVDDIELKKLNHSNLIIGATGSGKHTLVKCISEKFQIPVVDITENINLEYINQLYLTPTLLFCVIDGNKLTTKEQNALLKFIEEPRENIYIFILVDSEYLLLPTICNRCIKLRIPQYTKEELLNFTDNEHLLEIFTTPGNILRASKFDISALEAYINKMIDAAARANYPNFLSIKNKLKVQFSEIENNLDIFFIIFAKVLIDRIKADKSTSIYYDMYRCIDSYYKKSNIPKISIDDLFTLFLLDFKEIANGHQRA